VVSNPDTKEAFALHIPLITNRIIIYYLILLISVTTLHEETFKFFVLKTKKLTSTEPHTKVM